MWARIVEFLIAIWLVNSHCLFSCSFSSDFFWVSDLLCGFLIAIFALFSFIKRFEKIHLSSLVVAFWLMGLGFFGSSVSPPSFMLQNYFIVGFLLAMFAIVPSHSNHPPRGWRLFYKKVSYSGLLDHKGPSSWNQRFWVSGIALIAVGIAVYMGLYQWGLISHVWDPVFGIQSEKVLSSDVSHLLYKWGRIPDAIFGAIVYFGDVVFALAGSSQRWKDRPWLVFVFGLYVIPPAAVSIILVIIQGTVLNTWCFFCIITATISVFLIALTYAEVWASLLFLITIWKKTRNKQLLWDTFWGRPSEIAHQTAQTIGKK